MPRRSYRDAFIRALRQVSYNAQRLIRSGIAGLAAINNLRKQFVNLPMSWLSAGYQLGRDIQKSIGNFNAWQSNKPFYLNQIPIAKGLDTGSKIDNRILYRFHGTLRPKWSSVPRTFTIDVASNKALSPSAVMELARKQMQNVYSSYPNRRAGKIVEEYQEVSLELTYIARGY